MKKSKINFWQNKQIIVFWFLAIFTFLAIIFILFDIYNRSSRLISDLDNDTKRTIVYQSDDVLNIDSRQETIREGAYIVEPGTILDEAEKEIIAIPESSKPSNLSSNTLSENRRFSFILENDNFYSADGSGKEINVYFNDLIILEFKALDNDYDIFIPDYFNSPIIIQKGETELRRFQARVLGSSLYYCLSCGGIDSGAVGQINVFNR